VPVLCVLIEAMLSFSTIALNRANDYQLIPRSLTGDLNAVLSILTSAATSMVSLTAPVLTIVLVVVQSAMGQFSPPDRATPVNGRAQPFRHWLVRRDFRAHPADHSGGAPGDPGETGQVPGVGVIATFVLSFARLAVLVMYVHHVDRHCSASIELAGGDTRRLVDKIYPDTDQQDRV